MSARFTVSLILSGLVLVGLPLLASCGGSGSTSATSSPTTSISTSTSTISTGPGTSQPSGTWQADGILSDNEYAGKAQYGDYEIRWSSDGTDIHIGIRAKTDGWAAVGFGTGMLNADIVSGSVDNGQVTVVDLYSTGTFGPHPPDVELGGSDDISESGGREEGGYTTIEFSRPLDTGDKYDSVLTPGRIDIIWSFGSTDDINRQHITRGHGELDL